MASANMEFYWAVHGAAWLSAVLSAGALFATLWVLGFRERTERREAQARRVSAWVTSVEELRPRNEHGALVGLGGGLRGKSIQLTVHNGSDEPVYDFVPTIWLTYAEDSGRHTRESVLIPPGDSTLWVDGVELSQGGLADYPWVDIQFRDAKSQKWRRGHDGSFGQIDRKLSWGLAHSAILIGLFGVILASISLVLN
ncbi:hypothetical protein [Actinoplanes sp. DH11]|uniref:hypothetical protein n=1 Tax=Actinoplanes sp. DH11 TaxID=2857011 RepID=UPI001E51D075|nr:hypothetical protein [Actinoplanes sp. DH11]